MFDRKFVWLPLVTTLVLCILAPLNAGFAADIRMWKGELPIRQPWLRDNLPENALLYARVPNIYGLLTMPKGNVLDSALRSTANIENVAKVRRGITDNVLPQIPAFANLQLRLLEQYLRSPIEVAGFLSDAPSVVVSVNLELGSNSALEEVFELMGVGLLQPLDELGHGQMATAPVPSFLRFDEGTGHLLIHAGPAVTVEQFDSLLESFDSKVVHRMRTMEKRIDESGQGLFIWIDAERATPLLQAALPPDQAEALTASGLSEVSAAAIGWGVANGKGRLSVIADLPAGKERGYLPLVANNLTAKTVGEPDGLILASIPTEAEYLRLEAYALSNADDEARQAWDDTKATLQEMLAVSIEEVFRAVGPELLVIFDDAGDYSAIRIRDRKLWDSMLSRISNQFGGSPETRRIGGDTYYHVSLPNEFSFLDEEAAGEIGWWAVLMQRQRDHFYWVHDGDFIYLASSPQVLIDRAAKRARTNVGDWLKDRQRIDAESAILSFTGTSDKLPKRLYGVYIEILQLLADFAEADIDVWSMPTAGQLKLPDQGTMGFTLSFGAPTLMAEFTFENNPVEMMGGLGGVATLGIVAAVAIPAYQDYTVRADVSQGLALASTAKANVAEFYHEHGRFPGEAEAAQMSQLDTDNISVNSVVVEADSGTIVISYSESVAGGGEIYLYSNVGDGIFEWSCAGTFEDKHLPAACRDEAPVEIEDGDT